MPSSSDAINRISYISLVTSDNDKFNQTFQFYSQLGFRLTKSFSKVSSYGSGLGANHPEFQLGVSHDSLKEVWLESYPLQNVDSNGNLRPWQEMEVYDGDNCERLNESTVIKVRLLGETPLKSISQKQFVFSPLN